MGIDGQGMQGSAPAGAANGAASSQQLPPQQQSQQRVFRSVPLGRLDCCGDPATCPFSAPAPASCSPAAATGPAARLGAGQTSDRGAHNASSAHPAPLASPFSQPGESLSVGHPTGRFPQVSSGPAGEQLVGRGTPSLPSPARPPLKDIAHIHRSICSALEAFAKEARLLQRGGDVSASQLSALVERHRFLRSVCLFHSASEESVSAALGLQFEGRGLGTGAQRVGVLQGSLGR